MRADLQLVSRALMALMYCSVPGFVAAEMSVGGQVSVSTDHIFRGVSQTMSGAALEVEVDVEFENGWYGYAWGANVDYTDSLTPDDGADIEIDYGVGYVFAVNDDVTLGLEAVAYTFPGTKDGYDYNYEELLACMTIHDQHSLTVGFSDNVFGSAADGTFYALNSGLELSDEISLGIEIGHYDLSDSYATAYSYAALSVAGELRSVDWQLSYITTTDEDQEIFYDSTIKDRFMLELSMSF